jgi:c-di-GMP-related signal transduction protein
MNAYVTRKTVRSTARKIFAYIMNYSNDTDTEAKEAITTIISSIIQNFDDSAASSASSMNDVPTIFELDSRSLNSDILDKVYMLRQDSVYIAINSKIFELHDNEKLSLIQELKNNRYKVAVILNKEDTVFTMASTIADLVIFDINKIPDALLNNGNIFKCKKVATGINTADNYALAESAGIDYYEGNYVSEEDKIEIPDNQQSEISFVAIIREANNEKSSAKSIAALIKRDSIMSAKVIRLANSSYFGAYYKTDSVEQAVARLGIAQIKKWVYILQFSKSTGASRDLLELSYQRALLGEMITKDMKSREITSNDGYMIGLFAALDALTHKPIENQIESMNLSEVVSDALVYRDGIGGELINMIKAHEDGNWSRVDRYMPRFKLNRDKMYKYYIKASTEAGEIWAAVTDSENGKEKTEGKKKGKK